MPGAGRPTAELLFTDEERATLRRWARRRAQTPVVALRCRIVLECEKGRSNTEVADHLGVSSRTVGKWRRRFIDRRLQGVHDAVRSGAPRRVSDQELRRIVGKTLVELPVGATRWSTRSMAAATGWSQSTISRVWRAAGLHPERRRERGAERAVTGGVLREKGAS